MDNDAIARLLEYVFDDKCPGLKSYKIKEDSVSEDISSISNRNFPRILINTSYNVSFSEVWSSSHDQCSFEGPHHCETSAIDMTDDSDKCRIIDKQLTDESEVCALQNLTYPHVGDDQNKIKSAYWDDLRTVGYGRKERQKYPYYSDSFDPRMTFKGLGDLISSFDDGNVETKSQEQLAENVFLALEKPSDIMDTYLTTYRDCLQFLCSPVQRRPNQRGESEGSKSPNVVPIETDGTDECRKLFERIQSDSVKSIFTDRNQSHAENKNSNFMDNSEVMDTEECKTVHSCDSRSKSLVSNSKEQEDSNVAKGSAHPTNQSDDTKSIAEDKTNINHEVTRGSDAVKDSRDDRNEVQSRIPLYQRSREDVTKRDAKDDEAEKQSDDCCAAMEPSNDQDSDFVTSEPKTTEHSAVSTESHNKESCTWAKILFTKEKKECQEKSQSTPGEEEPDPKVTDLSNIRPTSEPFVQVSVKNNSSTSSLHQWKVTCSSNSNHDTKHEYGSQSKPPIVFRSSMSQMSTTDSLIDNHRPNYQTQTTNSIRYPQLQGSYWHQQIQLYNQQQQQQQHLQQQQQQQHNQQHPSYGLSNNYGSSHLSQEQWHRSNLTCTENRDQASTNHQCQQSHNYSHNMSGNMPTFVQPPPGFGNNSAPKPLTPRQQLFHPEPQNYAMPPQRQLIDHQPQHQLFPVNLVGNLVQQSRHTNNVPQQHYYPNSGLLRLPFYQNTQNNQMYQQPLGYRPNWCYNNNNNNNCNEENGNDIDNDYDMYYRSNMDNDYSNENRKEKVKVSKPRPIRSNLIRIYPSSDAAD